MESKIDIILSFAPHEVLSLTDAMLHPFFNNVYFYYTKFHFTLFLPFEEFVYMVAIPSHLFIPVDGKSFPCEELYKPLKGQRSPDVQIINEYPHAVMSKLSVDIVNADEACQYDELLQGIYVKNIFWHIASDEITSFIFIPHTSLALKITVDSEISVPNQIGIDTLRSVNKSNLKKIIPPTANSKRRLCLNRCKSE
ncbi:MAG: hypothetical protein R6V76_04515 [Desulfobacterales bacterium]